MVIHKMLEKNRDIFYHNPADWGKYRIERRTRIRCPDCGRGYWIQGDIPEQMRKPTISQPTISQPTISQPSWQQYIPELERLQVDIEAIIQKLKNIRLVE